MITICCSSLSLCSSLLFIAAISFSNSMFSLLSSFVSLCHNQSMIKRNMSKAHMYMCMIDSQAQITRMKQTIESKPSVVLPTTTLTHQLSFALRIPSQAGHVHFVAIFLYNNVKLKKEETANTGRQKLFLKSTIMFFFRASKAKATSKIASN